ncbi:AAA family ATPase [Halotia branconii]|uniref:ATP-binding protein n=1 Tax=Halotia branconii CENA392 TaxID=1539056 RepID=A0AAJ6NWY2_9CYAN|nr:ATP-binding protein [Halotia branconii]WGV28011.1 ATP-binding protein [Halotia branconii CENA392]
MTQKTKPNNQSSKPPTRTITAMKYYATSLQHILAELERIDLLIQVQLQRLQQIQSTDTAFQGLYISEEDLEAMLKKPVGMPHWAAASTPLSTDEVEDIFEQLADDIALCKEKSIKRNINLRLSALARSFQLTTIDIDILLICLAPELDLRYESLYAYLHGDVTKKRPSIDLVLNLLCPSLEQKLVTRQRFTPSHPLLKHHLLNVFDDPSQHQPPQLGKFLKLDDRIVNYLLNIDEIDSRINTYTKYKLPQAKLEDLLLPIEIKQRFQLLTQEKYILTEGCIFYFQGSYGVGKQATAEALCQQLGMGLLIVDGDRLLNSENVAFDIAINLVCREAYLQQAALYWKGFDSLLEDDKQARLLSFIKQLEDANLLTFLAGEVTWEPVDALQDIPFLRIEFSHPTNTERVQLWQKSLRDNTDFGSEADLKILASKFRFSGGQIADATATARNIAHWRDPKQQHLTMADIYAGCRLQSNRKLSNLATKINPYYKWDDIILPPDQMQMLREICNSVKYRTLIYEEWGFDNKLAMGKGVNVFFAGLPGTGKTMSANIIAGELGLDLYKIDLSSVVSKYIGETEKNLSRIFNEAQTSNAILFFDEADALFGKRSEVRDSHDRYANVEVSYLLQRMEEYQGVVILATNLRKNMDDAFVRRMHFSLEFPFPNKKERRRIWEQIFPKSTPKNPDVDLDFMAQRFEIAGGNIRNIALGAAFLAADDGMAISMNHLIWATRREYQKMGKILTEGEFGEYARLA